MEYTVSFTELELTTLFEALEVWEKEASSKALFSGLLTSMFIKDETESRQRIDAEMDEAKQKELMRKRQTIMLKAKLMSAMDDCTAAQLFNACLSNE